MLAVFGQRQVAEFVLLRMLALEDALALVSCCRLAWKLRVRPLALETSRLPPLDLSCVEALRYDGKADLPCSLPKLRALDIRLRYGTVLPDLYAIQTLRCRNFSVSFGFGHCPTLHTLALESRLTSSEAWQLVCNAPSLRRLYCGGLLHGAANALASLALEELTVREPVDVQTNPLAPTLHTLRLTIPHDTNYNYLFLLGLPGLRRLSLHNLQTHRTIQLRDLATAHNLETLRLYCFVIAIYADSEIKLPPNVRVAAFSDCEIQGSQGEIALTGNPRLQSFKLTSFSHVLLRVPPGLRHLVLGRVHLGSSFLQANDLSELESLELTVSVFGGSIPRDLPQPLTSLKRLVVRGHSLPLAWCEDLLTLFPGVLELGVGLFDCGASVPLNMARVLGQVRTLRLQVTRARLSFVESVVAAIGPALCELSIAGNLERGSLEALVLPEPIAARLTYLQLGARKLGQRATKVMPVDFITREIETELGY